MKWLIAIIVFMGSSSFLLAQGIQGNVKISGDATIVVTGHSAVLTWSNCQNASSYNIYRGTTHGGPYLKINSGLTRTNYIDVQVGHNQTLYYVVTAVYSGQESGYSNEAAVLIP